MLCAYKFPANVFAPFTVGVSYRLVKPGREYAIRETKKEIKAVYFFKNSYRSRALSIKPLKKMPENIQALIIKTA